MKMRPGLRLAIVWFMDIVVPRASFSFAIMSVRQMVAAGLLLSPSHRCQHRSTGHQGKY